MSANKAIRRLVKRIEDLKAENDDLQNQIDCHAEEYQTQIRNEENRAYQIAESARREKRENDYRLQQIRDEADSRRYEQQRLARDLERAVDWKRITGRDTFGDIDRITRKLSRGY